MADPKYVSLADVKAMLEKEQEKRELSYEQKLAMQHAATFVKLSTAKTGKLIKELEAVESVSSENAVKIADILPTEPEDVRAIFAKERSAVEKKTVDKVLEIVKSYL